MTRNREIELKAEQNTTNQLELEGYIKGAIYADQHPRKGLWDAEKVKQFLRDNTMFGNHPAVFEEFIKSLTQYMEE